MTALQNQALIKSMQASNNLDAIKIYIEEISIEDPQLQNGLKDETKDFDKCLTYIQKEAKKYLNSTNGFISPLVVFGWAIHYFTDYIEIINEQKEFQSNDDIEDETDDNEISKNLKNKYITTHSTKKVKNQNNVKHQFDLFSLLDEEN